MNAPAFFPRAETAPHRFTVEDVWRMAEIGVIDPDVPIEIWTERFSTWHPKGRSI